MDSFAVSRYPCNFDPDQDQARQNVWHPDSIPERTLKKVILKSADHTKACKNDSDAVKDENGVTCIIMSYLDLIIESQWCYFS